jgi:hypothetical protein
VADDVIIRGDRSSGSYVAFYLNSGRVDAAVGLNRPKDVRRIMPIIRARTVVNRDALQDERVDYGSMP